MRILSAFFVIAGALCAQSPSPTVAARGWQNVVDSMVARKAFNLATMATTLAPTQAVAASPSACSVPLLKMSIPPGVRFTIQTIEPPTKDIDHMEVVVPAPACTDPAR